MFLCLTTTTREFSTLTRNFRSPSPGVTPSSRSRRRTVRPLSSPPTHFYSVFTLSPSLPSSTPPDPPSFTSRQETISTSPHLFDPPTTVSLTCSSHSPPPSPARSHLPSPPHPFHTFPHDQNTKRTAQVYITTPRHGTFHLQPPNLPILQPSSVCPTPSPRFPYGVRGRNPAPVCSSRCCACNPLSYIISSS